MTVLPIPNGKNQWFYTNGSPLVGGTVAFYFPGGTNPKDTYADPLGTITNDNPITLDDRGEAVIWGTGQYRQIVKDPLGNTLYDEVTGALPTPNTAYLYLSFFFSSNNPPVANARLGGWRVPAPATFPANFLGPDSQFWCDTPPSLGNYSISILLNGSSVGAITVLVGSGIGSYSGSGFTVAEGDRVELIAQGTADTSFNNFYGTLAGTFS